MLRHVRGAWHIPPCPIAVVGDEEDGVDDIAAAAVHRQSVENIPSGTDKGMKNWRFLPILLVGGRHHKPRLSTLEQRRGMPPVPQVAEAAVEQKCRRR